MLCAASIKTGILWAWESFIISSIGFWTPSRFETWTILTNFVFWEINFLRFSMLKVLSLLDSQIFNFIPAFFNLSQGIRFELCSLSVIIISLPSLRPREFAIKLIPSVVFLVIIISEESFAFMNFLIISLAVSISSLSLLAN